MSSQQHEQSSYIDVEMGSSTTTTDSNRSSNELSAAATENSTNKQQTSLLLRRHTTSTTEAMTEEGKEYEFIDYAPPKPPPLPPPAKYKLWLVVLVLVYFAVWCSELAGIMSAFTPSGYLNTHAALFLILSIVVFVLTFAALDMAVCCLTFHVNNNMYGLERWLKSPRLCDKLGKYDNVCAQFAAVVMSILENGFCIFNPPEQLSIQKPIQYDCNDYEGQVVLKIEHRLKPDSWDEFHVWQKKICKLANSQPGLVEVKICEQENDMQVVMVTFDSIDRLNEYMNSPARQKLMKQLEPLQQVPDALQLQKDRNLPDAFTDLLARQGECVPALQPKKWKVWWLTTCGLFLVNLTQEAVQPYYFQKWGLNDSHDRLRGLVATIFATFFNSFIMTPFLIMLFSDWVKRKPNETDTKEPWRTLNDGLSTIWQKLLVTVAFYGGCIIAWLVKNSL
jgi:antibiotic biosynthesis monooxygenase (ABM) superfamily enzyme